ncbi:Xaa-Pro aminopeptidase [Desulfosalsimonas propionicica]|uniref:Xaa-Pro aminopeptidase n=1 Tax=Desulfosalsimonas propionicica TaxID=332175 RepID=A0A7W0C8E6_9BACT|nr:Xaa-Pro peptidase family protein [Desulfosalsimonas propionicica]MBA2881081.1 Xaa-Pro aminopeptidase [Desulfosalsimonas propionicica]
MDFGPSTPPEELHARVRKLQQHLQEKQLQGALILQKADLFYFSGTIQQAHLFIPAEGEAVLMVRKDIERARAESALSQVVSLSSPKQIPEILGRHGIDRPARLGMELDVLPANLYFNFIRLFENAEITDISTAIRMIRAVKSDYEIDKIRTAARFSDRLAACVPDLLKEGIPEVELAGRIEAEARKMGHQGIVRMRLWGAELFYGHVMAGSAAAVPSYLSSPTGGAGVNAYVAQGAGMRPVGRNEPVLVDMVFAFEGYNSDHARIYSIGELPADLTAAHQVMRDIQEAVKKAALPGTAAGDLYELALNMAEDKGLGDCFMGTGAQRIRFVGHGIGLELDEFPFLARGQKLALEPGMIIALEPKVIFPEKGVVGIENTHVVTQNGLEQLGEYPEEITVI